MTNVADEIAGVGLLRSAIDTLPVHFAVLDAEGRTLWTNRAWREFAVATDSRMRPDSLGVNYPAVMNAADDEHAARAAAGLRTVLGGKREQFQVEYPCGSRDGRHWFTMCAASFTRDRAQYVAVAHLDVTDRKARETALRDAYEISTAAGSFDERLDALLELVRDTIGTDCATLSRVRDDEYVFEAVATPTDLDLDLEAGETVPIETLPNCERVVETERTLVLGDVEAEAPALADPEWGISSYLGAPVLVDGDVYGTFCFYGTEPREETFSDWEVTFVDLLCNWVSHELERRERERKLQQIRENITDVVWMSSPEKDEIEFISDSYGDVWGRPPEALVDDSMSFVDAVHPDDRDRVRAALAEQRDHPDGYEETYRIVRPDGEVRWIHDRSAGVHDDDGTLQRIVGVANDVTERKTRERALERQRDELAQLQRLNTLVRSIIQAVRDTTTRDAIETAVCERLTESELYQAVWIGARGESETGDSNVIPRTAAGVDDAYVDGIPGDERGPAWTAIETDEVQIVDDIATADGFPDSRRETAIAHGHHALAAVPLSTGETTYGVLVVYAPPGHAVGDAEQVVLADLGRSIALAIQRVHSHRSLTARTVVALDLRIPDTDFVFGEVSTELDCELSLDRRIPADDGTTIYYLRIDGGAPGHACELLGESPLATACTVVRDAGSSRSALVELHLNDTPRLPLDVLTDYGASVRTARVADGDVSLGVELPPEVDVRTVLGAIREVAPSIELIRKRHVDRPDTTAVAFQERVTDRLTRKQAATLEAAYARGYYEWPRNSTVEELSGTFDVSAPTLHYRLRKAHRTVMSALLDDEHTRADS